MRIVIVRIIIPYYHSVVRVDERERARPWHELLLLVVITLGIVLARAIREHAPGAGRNM